MRTLLVYILSFSLVSAYAIACPDLGGHYDRCKANAISDMFDMDSAQIIQKKIHGVTHYTLDTVKNGQPSAHSEFTADGKPVVKKGHDSSMGDYERTVIATCKTDTLEVLGTVKAENNFEMSQRLVLKRGENGEFLLNEYLDANDGEASVKVICEKN